MATKSARNVHRPRVRELIRATGNPDLFPELNIPRSTISGWLRGDFKLAVGAEAVRSDTPIRPPEWPCSVGRPRSCVSRRALARSSRLRIGWDDVCGKDRGMFLNNSPPLGGPQLVRIDRSGSGGIC